ncbi:conserved hypothetical protein [Gammaproteobacteria bacterium]
MNNSINLYNPAFRKRKSLLSAFQMITGLFLVIVGIFAFYIYTLKIENNLRQQEIEFKTTLDNQQAQVNILVANLASRKATANLSNEIMERDRQLRNRRQLFLTLSEGLSHRHGYSRYLRAFARQSLEGLWITAFSIEGLEERLWIRGRALLPALIPRYLKRLGQESDLRGRNFAALKIAQVVNNSSTTKASLGGSSVIEFTITSVEESVSK